MRENEFNRKISWDEVHTKGGYLSLEESAKNAREKGKRYLVTGIYGEDDVYDPNTLVKLGKVKDLLESFEKGPK